jgi:Arc/MetJ-type ribon-helix-helix transcriptional regulator
VIYSRRNYGIRNGVQPGGNEMKLVTLHIPEQYIEGLEKLVDSRLYPNRSEAIRIAIRDLLKRELWR